MPNLNESAISTPIIRNATDSQAKMPARFSIKSVVGLPVALIRT